jgi:hypothetical protein
LLAGGADTVAILSAFCDESGTDVHSRITYVGGYLFNEDGQKEFTTKWASTWKPYADRGFPNLHLTDWANPNHLFFKSTTDNERKQILNDLIDLIRGTALLGVISSLDNDIYNASTDKNKSKSLIGSKYTSCAIRTLFAFSGITFEEERESKISYLFESGNEFQGEADHMMKRVKSDSRLVARLRYAGHGFHPKCSLLPLQAADALLWIWNRHQKDGRYEEYLDRLRAPGGVNTYLQEVTEMSLDFLAIHNISLGIESNRKYEKQIGPVRIFHM